MYCIVLSIFYIRILVNTQLSFYAVIITFCIIRNRIERIALFKKECNKEIA